MPSYRVQRPSECDEVAGNEPRPLVNQLIKRVLAVGTRLAKIDRAGIAGHALAIEHHLLTVALHCQLLQVGRKPLQVLLVRQYGHRLRAEEIGVPDGQQAHYARADCDRTAPYGSARPSRWQPPSIARKFSGPMASIVDSPIADIIE